MPRPSTPNSSDEAAPQPAARNAIDRRDFLRLGGLGLTAAMLPAAARAADEAPKPQSAPSGGDGRPNILFIWVDQLTRSAMSHAGNVHLRTPAMDSIAREGVVFERAYTSDPICVPSRTGWITGSPSHRTTVSFNCPRHGIAVPPLSPLMKAAGYDTGYVGKWHIPHPATDMGWHGFDYVRHAKANELDPFVVGDCTEFLKTKRSKPFFLVASFVDPHDICEWARMEAGIQDRFKNGEVPRPPPPDQCPPVPDNFPIPAFEPEVIRQLKALNPNVYPSAGWDEGMWRQYLWVYYRLIELVDSRIAQLLKTLKDEGLDDNTLIVFASDHGDGAAAHHWNQKTVFFEEVVGVPFIVRPPKCPRAGVRDASNLVCMNLDFFPTVFDYAGITPPAGLLGKSVRPLVEGVPGATGHDFVVSQNDLAPISGQSGKVYGRMVRTKRYKYARYSTGLHPEQLFDTGLDAGEMNNLVENPAYAGELARHRDLLDTWMKREGDPFPNAICAEDLTMVSHGAGD